MQRVKKTNSLPVWLDSETRVLVKDIITTLSERHPDLLAVMLFGSVARHEERSLDEPDPSDVDLLAVLDSDDPHISIREGEALFHSLGLAYTRHLDAPREVKVMFTSRTFQEWDQTFVENVSRDGIVLFQRGKLPAPFAA